MSELPGQVPLYALPIVRLAHGEAIPGHRLACTNEGCGHANVWHSHTNRNRPCEVDGCRCPRLRKSAQLLADRD
jgi:hypothetical protein